MGIKRKVLFYKLKVFPALFSSKNMSDYLRECGIQIGKGCRFYRPSSMNIDISKPANLKIGDYCKITSNVTILAHDYSYSVARRVYGVTLEKHFVTIIGNNVFIGMGAIIMPGAQIGDNVIVGSGSVVNGIVPDNMVVAGNPAKIICTLEEYCEKRIASQAEEAKREYLHLKQYYGRRPTVVQMGNFYPLYIERDKEKIISSGVRINLGGDNKDDVMTDLLKSKGMFSSFEEFCDWAEQE